MLAASDIERFHSGHRGILFEHQKLKLIMSKTETFGIGESIYIFVYRITTKEAPDDIPDLDVLRN